MYEMQFTATNSAGWAEAIELIDANTNLPLILDDDATIELDVRDGGNCQLLEASSANGKIERPQPNVIQWRFTREEMGGLCRSRTYRVGCVITDDGGTTQLFIGTLAFLNGEVS